MPARAERSPGEGMPQSDDDRPTGFSLASGARVNGRLDSSVPTVRNGVEPAAPPPVRQAESQAAPRIPSALQGPIAGRAG